MILALPWPPSNNVYYRHDRGVTHLSAKGRQYRAAVHAAVLIQRERVGPMFGILEMRIIVCPPNRIQRDLDNLLKAPQDALAWAAVYKNDSQIKRLIIEEDEHWIPDGAGMLRVSIEEIPWPEPRPMARRKK